MEQNYFFKSDNYSDRICVLVDLKDKEYLRGLLGATYQRLLDFLKNEARYHDDTQSEPIYFEKAKADEKPTRIEAQYFFDQVLEQYPDLTPELAKWITYPNSLGEAGGHCTDEYGKYLFLEPILALALHDKKYIRDFIQFMQTNDMDHETDEYQEEPMDAIFDKWGICNETVELVAARQGSIHGQQGRGVNFDFAAMTEEHRNHFMRYLLQNMNFFKRYTVEDRSRIWIKPALKLAGISIPEERIHQIVSATADHKDDRSNPVDSPEIIQAKIAKNWAIMPSLAQLESTDFEMPEFDYPQR